MAEVENKRPKRRYVQRAQARGLLIDAAIELLRELPFAEVTTRRIAAKADLNLVAIQTNFGSQMGLMVAAAIELGDRVARAVAGLSLEETVEAMLVNPDAILRTRLVAWALGNGVDPDELRRARSEQLARAVADRHDDLGIHSELGRTFTQMAFYLLDGFITFSPTHDHRPDELSRATELLGAIRRHLPAIQSELSWVPVGA